MKLDVKTKSCSGVVSVECLRSSDEPSITVCPEMFKTKMSKSRSNFKRFARNLIYFGFGLFFMWSFSVLLCMHKELSKDWACGTQIT